MKRKYLTTLTKITLLMLIISYPVHATLTKEEAAEKAMPYVEVAEGETIDISPSQRIEVDGEEYWPFEVRELGTIRFMIPIHQETGEIAEENYWEQIMETHYLANFFATTDSIMNYLESAQDFAQDKKSTFGNEESSLRSHQELLEENVTPPTIEPLREKLQKGEEKAEELRTQTITTKAKSEEITTPENKVEMESEINSVFQIQRDLIEIGREIEDKAWDLESDIEKIGVEEIGDRAYDMLQTAADLKIDYTGMESTLDENERQINNLFKDIIEEEVQSYQSRLGSRLEISEEEKERNEIIYQLEEYSQELENISQKGIEEVPEAYLKEEEFELIEEDTIEIIKESIEKCEPEKDIEEINMDECREAENKYTEIENNIEEMKQVIEGYDPECEPGETRECTIDGEDGIQQCGEDGLWEPCEPIEETAEINWTLVGSLAAIIIILTLYRYRGKLKSEEENEEETNEMDEMWR